MQRPLLSPRRLSFRAPWVIFWVGLGVRLLCIVIGHTYRIRIRDDHWEFGYEAGRLARSLVTGHGYANPFDAPSGPSAWLSPLFPLLMAGCFKLFGLYTKLAAFAIMAVDSVFSALVAPAVYEMAARCFDAFGLVRRNSAKATPVALWSGWLWALHPEAIQYPIHWLWEMSLSTCLFAWALVMALRLRRLGETDAADDARRDWTLWTWSGALWGLLALSNPTLLICAPAVVAWVVWPRLRGTRAGAGLGRSLAGVAWMVALVGLLLTPWIVRNERTMHAFIPTRSNFGIEFWNATVWEHGAYPWGSAVPLSPREHDFRTFASMGEVAYAKMRGQQAVANVKAHPELYLKYTAQRVQFFWFIWRHASDAKPVAETLRLWNYGFLSLCGLLGVALALKRRVPGAWMMFWVMLLVPIPYYMVTVQARFRHPIEPIIFVLMVYLFRATGKQGAEATEQRVGGGGFE